MNNANGLCEWCGGPLNKARPRKVASDRICIPCYCGYRKDKQQVKLLWKGVEKHG